VFPGRFIGIGSRGRSGGRGWRWGRCRVLSRLGFGGELQAVRPFLVILCLDLLSADLIDEPVGLHLQHGALLGLHGGSVLDTPGSVLDIDNLLLELTDPVMEPRDVGPDGVMGLLRGGGLDGPFVLGHLLLVLRDSLENLPGFFPEERGLVPKLLDLGVQPSDAGLDLRREPLVLGGELAEFGDVGVSLPSKEPGTSGQVDRRSGGGGRRRRLISSHAPRSSSRGTRDICVPQT
jgi:hypothetical protein